MTLYDDALVGESDTIEIAIYRSGQLVDVAYATDAESAVLAARTLWDESLPQLQGAAKATSTVFRVNGEQVRLIEGRRV